MFGGSSSPFILTSFAAGSGGGGGGAGFGFQLGGIVVAGTGNTPTNGFTLSDGGANTMVFDPSSPSLIVQSANFGSTTRANFFDVSSRTDLTEATLAPASLQLFNAAGVITINADATVPSITLADGTGNTNVADATDVQLAFPSNNNALVQISSSFITGIQASDSGGTGSCEAAHLSHQLVSGQNTSIIGGVIHSEDDTGNFFITSDATVPSTTWSNGAGKLVVVDGSNAIISTDDGAGNLAFLGGSNPAMQLVGSDGSSNNQNASSITVTDGGAGSNISIQPGSTLISITNGVTSAVAMYEVSLITLAGSTSGTLELDAPAVAGTSVQKFLPASGNIAVETNAPVTATSAGVTGQIAFDSGFFYVCIATNTWVRTVLVTF